MASQSHDGDVAFIEALAKLLRDNDLTELEVKRDYAEDDSLNVRVSRAAPVVAAAPAQMQIAAPAAAAATPAPASPLAEAAPQDPAAHPGAVTLPIVGTV